MDVRQINEVEVYHNSKLVGFLKQLENNSCAFVYCKEWLKNGFSISPFKMPLENKVFICNDYLVNYMFGVFYDCLPDSWGNKIIDKFLVKNSINPNELSLLQRLTLLDESSLGSLSFKPRVIKIEKKYNEIDFDSMFLKIKDFIRNDEISDIDILNFYHKGSSTGGSRPKANAKIENLDFIVKFPSNLDPINIGEEEYKLNMLAKECGLNVEDCIFLPSKNNNGYFAAKRFDRENNKRLHIISLAGLFDLEPSLSQIHYLGFLQTVNILCNEDLDEAIGRMIFNYLIDNKDDHPRNISFYYDENNKKYRLTPFFDITSTPEIKEHMMLVNDTNEPSLDDYLAIVSKVNVSKDRFLGIYNRIFKQVEKYKNNCKTK